MAEGDRLTHIRADGSAAMVDVSGKPVVRREAVAESFIALRAETLTAIADGSTPKGDVLAVARVAGIQAAKDTDRLIPLCHTLPLDAVSIEFERTAPDRLRIVATASTTAKTGVEMEALTAASVAALTLYDMTKAVDRDLRIDAIRLVDKRKQPVE